MQIPDKSLIPQSLEAGEMKIACDFGGVCRQWPREYTYQGTKYIYQHQLVMDEDMAEHFAGFALYRS